MKPRLESDSDAGQRTGSSVRTPQEQADAESRRTNLIFKALLGLTSGLFGGALIACLFVLFVLGYAQTWNERGTVMGGISDEHSLTLAQIITLVFGGCGAVIGGFLGLLIGLLSSIRRRKRVRAPD